MVRGDILSLLRFCREKRGSCDTLVALDTSGAGITGETALALAGLADTVRLSLDGPEEINDRQRGPGSYKTAMKAFENLREAGFEPEVGVTVTSLNADVLPEFLGTLVELGCRSISVNMLRPVGRATENPDLQPGKERFRRSVSLSRKALGLSAEDNGDGKPGGSCGAGRYLSILPDGGIYPCHVLHLEEFQLGNAAENGLGPSLHPDGLLARLRRLDLRKLALLDPELADLGESDTCLGRVYRATRNNPQWDDLHLKAIRKLDK